MSELRDELEEIFREVFDDRTIALRDETTANDIDGWDSLMHINLIIAVERRFGVKFATAEISAMKAEGRDIGFLVQLLRRKLGPTR